MGCGAKVRYLKVFGGMRRVAAVSGSRQRSRQRCEMASKELASTLTVCITWYLD